MIQRPRMAAHQSATWKAGLILGFTGTKIDASAARAKKPQASTCRVGPSEAPDGRTISTSIAPNDQRKPLNQNGICTAPERSARRLETLRRDAPGYALHQDLHAHDADLRVTKRFYSAMAPGSSELEPLLRGRGVDTLLIAGTVTNVCCESTARDAMMRDFRTIMVDDALAAVTPAEHEHALHGWMLFFGDVLSVDEAAARLRPARPQRRTA